MNPDLSGQACCAMMRAQLDWSCDQHAEAADCPDALIGCGESGRFGIYVHDGGSSWIGIRFCPWCGTQLSDGAIPDKPHFSLAGSVASLRVSGDPIDPQEIARLLGCEPDRVTSRSWSVCTPRRGPADLDRQIGDLLSRLTSDPGPWSALAARYRIDIFCGLFLQGANEGISISAASSAALSARHIELGLDIYGGGLSARDGFRTDDTPGAA